MSTSPNSKLEDFLATEGERVTKKEKENQQKNYAALLQALQKFFNKK